MAENKPTSLNPSFRPQSAQDQQNEILEEAYFEKLLASKKETRFDLKNFKPGEKTLVVPLAKLNSESARPDDLELKAFQDAEQIIRELGQGTVSQTQSEQSASSAESRLHPSIPGKLEAND